MCKLLTIFSKAGILLGLSVSLQATVTGLWNFEQGDLTAAVGEPLEYFDGAGGATEQGTVFGTTTDLGLPGINGEPAHVMGFPKATPDMGYIVYHGVEANGDFGAEHYTFILDLLFPPESHSVWRALIQIDDPFNTNDSEYFINPGNGIGIGGQYHGTVLPETWHRIIFVKEGVDLHKYIDGVKVGQQVLGGGGARWTLDPAPWGLALLFTDENNETAAGFASSIQFRNRPLTDLEVAALGGAAASGIPVEIPTGGVAPQVTSPPQSQIVSAGGRVEFSVEAVGSAPLAYQWRHNGEEIAGATGTTYVIESARGTHGGDYDVVVSNPTGSTTSPVARLGVFAGPVSQDLVLHLKFDDDFQDASGRGNHGAHVVQPEAPWTDIDFASGGSQLAGSHSLILYEGQHVALGRPDDLLFGSSVNFTISFWVKGDPGAWNSDPSFISNKNWASGSNRGYIIAAQGNGGWKWNYTGANAGRRDTPNLGVITDSEWHHILVMHDRGGVASFYLDGQLLQTIPIAGDGDVDALDINIGNDGTGRYGFDNDMAARYSEVHLDEVGIWRRTLTPQEITAIYEGGLEGQDLSQIEVASGPPPEEIIGYWDFSAGNLSATIGSDLEFVGDIQAQTEFGTMPIEGQPAQTMCFPSATPAQGFLMRHDAGGNAGGERLNQYTLIMDVMFPQESHGQWRALFQTDPSNESDADLFVNTGNGIGISGQYQGEVLPDTWHRLVFAFDLTQNTLGKYIDGTLVNLQTLSATSGGVDQRWSLGPEALFFTDEDGETSPGCVSAIQVRSVRLSDVEIASLGGASATGIPLEISVILVPPQFTDQPLSRVVSAGTDVTFSVGLLGTEPFQYQWRFNEIPIQGATSAALTLTNVRASDAGEYDVVVTSPAGTITSNKARLEVFTGQITDDLVVHLPFENSLEDTSGRGNHAEPVGSPTFVGNGGQRVGAHAVNIGSGTYLSLGRPDDLLFGSDVNFSVSFWMRAGDWSSDPSLISNKDWNSGGNPGWIISVQSGGTWKWNWKGANEGRRDVNQVAQVRDDEWHHILVTHERTGTAAFYHNGELRATTPIAGDGNVDALDINIGQDGTGNYGAQFPDLFIDDLGVWRRVVTAEEAAAIYQSGLQGLPLTSVELGGEEMAIQAVVLQAGNLVISWSGGSGIKLQKASSLSDPDWQDVPGTEGGSSATEAITGDQAYYRLVKE